MRSPLHILLISGATVAASFLITSVALSDTELDYPVDLPASCLNGINEQNVATCCMQENMDYEWGTVWTKRCCQYNPDFPYCFATEGPQHKYCCLHISERGRPADYCTRMKDTICADRLGTNYSTMQGCFNECPEEGDADSGTITPP